jgi:hypothetical protein
VRQGCLIGPGSRAARAALHSRGGVRCGEVVWVGRPCSHAGCRRDAPTALHCPARTPCAHGARCSAPSSATSSAARRPRSAADKAHLKFHVPDPSADDEEEVGGGTRVALAALRTAPGKAGAQPRRGTPAGGGVRARAPARRRHGCPPARRLARSLHRVPHIFLTVGFPFRPPPAAARDRRHVDRRARGRLPPPPPQPHHLAGPKRRLLHGRQDARLARAHICG